MKTRWLMLYPEDFNVRVWKEICDVLDVPYNAKEIELQLTDDRIVFRGEEE